MEGEGETTVRFKLVRFKLVERESEKGARDQNSSMRQADAVK